MLSVLKIKMLERIFWGEFEGDADILGYFWKLWKAAAKPKKIRWAEGF